MQSVIPPGDPKHTLIAGQKQGFLGLAINFGETVDTNFPGRVFPTMVTAWEPTDKERIDIANGANIIVRQLGRPPINPMSVYVGDRPERVGTDLAEMIRTVMPIRIEQGDKSLRIHGLPPRVPCRVVADDLWQEICKALGV